MLILVLGCLFATYECASVINADCAKFDPQLSCVSLASAKSCGFVTHCIDTVWKNQEHVETNSEFCEFCETVVGEIKEQFSNETLDVIINYMNQICLMCPDKAVQDECKSLVEQYASEIFQMIRAKLDPQVVCTAMGLCPGSLKVDMQTTIAHSVLLRGAPLLTDVTVPKETENAVVVEEAKKVKPVEDVLCDDCKQFINDLEQLITNKTTEKEIEDYLEQMCTQLKPIEDMCKSYVKEYIPVIMEMLKAELDPEMICESLEICPGELNHLELIRWTLKRTTLYQAAIHSKHSSEECELCQFVMSQIQHMERSATVQEEIKMFLENEVCAHLGSYKDECDQSIEAYATIVFELLANELDPMTRCRSFGFCPVNSTIIDGSGSKLLLPPFDAAVPEPHSNGPSSTCILCEFVMNKLMAYITTNSTEEEILSALETVCRVFPKSIADECSAFVDTYGPAIIMLIKSEVSAEEICTELNLCKPVTQKIIPAMKLVPNKSQLKGAEACGVCETIIQYVDSLLEDNHTTTAIEKALEKVCNYMPDTFKADCQDFIRTYGPEVVRTLVQEAAPEAVCTALGLCSSEGISKSAQMATLIKAKPVGMVGVHQCSWGPAYWCASEENAIRCQAIDHCHRVGALPKH